MNTLFLEHYDKVVKQFITLCFFRHCAAIRREQKPVKASPSQQALIKEKKRQDRLMARQAKKDELKKKADEDRAKKKEARLKFVIHIPLIIMRLTPLNFSSELQHYDGNVQEMSVQCQATSVT